MNLDHAITSLETAVDNQLRIAGPEIAEAGSQLMVALKPAITQTLMDVVEMAVTEVSSQLDTQAIDIRLVDGDPELVVRDNPGAVSAPPPAPQGEDAEFDEARITLRLPGYLKDLIAAEAERAGDSVNSYVVDVLGSRTRRRRETGTQTRTKLEL